MKKIQINITIPAEVDFSDLRLARDPVSGDISFEGDIVRSICDNNNLPFQVYAINALLVAWYAHHRRHGGPPDPVMEQIIAEVEAEAVTGVAMRGGTGRLN